MLGGAEEWFYRGLGGIDFDLSRADAAERITIRPRIVDGVTWEQCGYVSTLGKIESDWKRDGAVTTMEVTVPAGAQATVVIPVRTGAPVIEGGTAADKAEGVTFVRRENGNAIYRVGSGVFRFSVTDLDL